MHSFSDLAAVPGIRAAADLAAFHDLSYPVARAVVQACREAYDLGLAGESHDTPVASSALADLVADAWHDGVTKLDRVTVVLSSETDGVCECDRSVAHYADSCTCGSTSINRNVMVTVSAPFAEEWADSDQCIDGSSWESCGEDLVYTILSNRPGLVSDLMQSGYKLDLSAYEEASQ